MKKLLILIISFNIGLLTPSTENNAVCSAGCCTYDYAGNCICCAAPKKGGGYTCSGCGGLILR